MHEFPKFEETTFYKQWLAAELAYPAQTEEQRAACLRMALGLYRHCREEWESDQRRDARGDGLSLAS